MPMPERQVPEPHSQPNLPEGWLRRWPWATFLVPMIVYMLGTSLEPKPPENGPGQAQMGENTSQTSAETAPGDEGPGDDQFEDDPLDSDWEEPSSGLIPEIPSRYYPWVYTSKIVLTIFAMVLVWPGYRTFPWQASLLAVAVGI